MMSSLWTRIHAYKRGEISGIGMITEVLKSATDRRGTILNRLPLSVFFEHMLIFGTTGAGKSNIYELLVKRFVPDALDGKMSLVIVDGSIFPNRVIRHVDRALKRVNSDRLVLLDPQPGKGRSMEHMVQANIFDMPEAIRDQASPDFISGFYTDVCQSLFDCPLTDNMKNLLGAASQLMEEIGTPSLPLLRDIIDRPGDFICRSEDDELRQWFEQKVMARGAVYAPTVKFVSSRLDTILRSKTLRRMFCAEEPKINLFDKVLSGCLLVVATRTASVSDEVARTMGRLGLMLAGQISQMKAMVDGVDSLLLCDEAHEYGIEKDIPSIRMSYKKDRKNGDGRALALQQPGDFSQLMLDTVMNCSAVKCFGRMENDADAKKLGKNIGIAPEDLMGLQAGEFFVKVRGQHDKGIRIVVPPGSLGRWKNNADKKRMRSEAIESVNRARVSMAKRYGSKPKKVARKRRMADSNVHVMRRSA